MKQKCLTMVKVMTALVLAVLMMVGSVSNVVGAIVEQASFDGGSVLAASAEKGLEIAENANSSEEADADAPDLSAFEENEIVRGMKEDLAVTGVGIDLANTGATYYIWKAEDGGGSSSEYTCLGASPQNLTATAGKNYYIAISTSSSSVTSGSVTLTGADFTDVSVSGQGVQQFDGNAYQSYRFSLSSATTLSISYTSGTTIKVTGGGSSSSSCTTDHRMIVTGSKQLTNTDNWQNTWSGAGTRNQMTYNSSVRMYEIKYTNIAANSSSSDHFRFRILDLTTKGDPDTDWETDKGYDQGSGAISDASNLLQYSAKGTDNTFEFSLSAKANITIYLDDSKLDTNSAIQVIITPAVSTVTAGTQTGGTVKVNNASSASNITYGGSVTLTATPSANYVFSKWNNNTYLTYANQNAASTTATVTGTTTVNATFTKASFSVTRGTGGTDDTDAFTITTPSSTQTKQWGTSVSVTAKTTDDLHYIDYLYYLNNDSGAEQVISGGAAAGAGTTATLSGSFTMPTNNVTVYAHTHKRETKDFTYGYVTGCDSMGYINVGKQHNSVTNQIEYSIDSPGSVIEGTKVLFGARAKADYKFLGWYSDQAGNNLISGMTDGDESVLNPTGTYYAKFAYREDYTDPLMPANDTIRVLIKKNTNQETSDLYSWDPDNTNTKHTGNWPGTVLGSVPSGQTTVTVTSNYSYNNNTYYKYDFKVDKLSIILNNGTGGNNNQTADITGMTKGNAYVFTYNGGNSYTADEKPHTDGSYADPDAATTTYYPVNLTVTNPDKGHSDYGSTGAYTDNYFVAAESNAKIYAKPNSTDNDKTRYQLVSGSTNIDTKKIFTSTTSTQYETGTMKASAEALNATITYIAKDYYPVTFSAGPHGTVTAQADSVGIKSGDKVKEGTSVSFTGTPATGYAFAQWTGDSTSTTSPVSLEVNSTNQGVNVKGFFKDDDKGTEITGKYLAYGTNISYQQWTTGLKLYHKNGRVLAYLDNPTNSSTYYFSLCDYTDPKNHLDGNNLAAGCWGWNKSGTTCVTDFGAYLSNTGVQSYDVYWDYNDGNGNQKRGTNYYGKTTINSSSVSKLIIDVGSWNGTDLSFSDSYRVIPVYDTDVTNVDVYAKNGSYRGDAEYDYFNSIADTDILNTSTGVSNIKEQGNFDTAAANIGSTVKVKTTVKSAYRGTYYVQGFCVNGVTPALLTADTTNGEYELEYTIPADFKYDYLEITPIYSLVDNSNTVKFYIENYDEAFQATGWGNTLAVYPFYDELEKKDNAFGGYPGQPVINYGGRRFVEVPLSHSSKTVKGVTLSNDYWDVVHREYVDEVAEHMQTYDYDDFYKIFKETSDGLEVNHSGNDGRNTVADQITFAFKYRDDTNNFIDSSNTTNNYAGNGKTVHTPYSSFTNAEKTSKFGNGWEPLLDYHDRPVDLFGKQLTSEQQTAEPLLVVSDDYAVTYAGYYATTWTVYDKNAGGTGYTKIAEIAPSALIVTSAARLDNGTYVVVNEETGTPTTQKLADFKDEYTLLHTDTYMGRPVEITYESEIENNSSYEKYFNFTTGKMYKSELAKRSDGRWFYSYEGEFINANLRIDYTSEYTGEKTTVWTTDTLSGNKGAVTKASVQFTNHSTDIDGPYELDGYVDTVDYNNDHPNDKVVSNFNHFYKFAATEGSGYIFMGWYMERDDISTAVNDGDLDGKSQMTSNATFVARYVKNPAGHVTINHELADGSTGTATTYIGVKAIAPDGTSSWLTGAQTDADHFSAVDSFSINDTNIMSYNSGYTLEVTLKTTVNTDTSFERFSAATGTNDKSSEYFSSDVTTAGNDSTTTFSIPVNDLFELNANGLPQQKEYYDTFTYYSHTVKKPELTINHNLDPTSESTAEGDTYVKVEVLNSGGTSVIATYGGEEADGYAKGEDLIVPSTYFNSTTNVKIKVYLKTEMKGFTQFDHFSILGNTITNAAGPHGETITLSSSTDQRTKFATSTFSASACYNRGEFVLPYLSRLIVPDYKYELTYTYPSYLKEYGNQSYTAKDSFAPEELTEYMTLDNGDLAFQDNAKKLSFVCLKAPYENNFQKTIDYSKTTVFDERGYNSSDHTLKLGVSVDAENEQLSAYFDFPYQTNVNDGDEFVYLVENDKVIKTDTNRQGKTNIYGRDWFVINDSRTQKAWDTTGVAPEFVKAPLIIYDGATPKYFKYWSVMTEGTAKYATREYTRCYDYEFNLAIFQNCIITPEYDNVDFATRGMAGTVPTTYDGYDRFDPDVNREFYKTEDNGLTITFIENSRNQYNNRDAGSAPSERSGAADRLYSDFLLTYNYYDANVNYSQVVLRDDYEGQKKAGMVIQPVAYMEKTADGKGRIVQSDEYYANYSASTKYQGATAEQIEYYIENGTVPSGMLGGQNLQDSRFDVSSLDNKNRIQYFFGMDNAVAKDSNATADEDGILRVGADYNNKYLVYKAFAYIGDVTNGNTLTNVVVSSRPVYFTVYTDATIQPGYYMPNTSGN